jgi:hypothetical protein
MPTREYDSAHFSSIPAAQRAMAEDAAEDERLRQEAWRRQREHDLRLGREATARLWEAQRDGSRAWSSEALETARQAVKAGQFEDALAAAIGIPAFERVLELAEAELAAHLLKVVQF